MLRFPYRQVFGDPANEPGKPVRRRVPADGVLQRRDGHQERHEIRQPRAALHGGDQPMSPLDPELIGKLVFEPRWTAVTKLDVDARVIGTWDEDLVRDVAAARADRRAGAVRRPRRRRADGAAAARRWTPPDGKGAGFPAPFDGGATRPPGVHLHWAMPDALLRGELGDRHGQQPARRCPRCPTAGSCSGCSPRSAPPRSRCAAGCSRPTARSPSTWPTWPAGSATATPSGAPLDKAALTGTAGGAPTWAATYDSVLEPLRPPRPARRRGARSPPAASTATAPPTWSPAGGPTPPLDPLDAASNQGSLDALLHGLGWSAVAPWVDAPADQRSRDEVSRLRTSVSLRSARRFMTPEGTEPPATPHIAADAIRPLTSAVRSGLLEGAAAAYVTTPWWPHASLLHGASTACRSAPTPVRRSTTGRRRRRCGWRSAATTTT